MPFMPFSLKASPRRLALVGVLSAGFVIALSSAGFAADVPTSVDLFPDVPKVESHLSFQGNLAEQGSYESNPLLLTHGGSSLYGSVTTADLDFNDSTPNSKIGFNNTINENLFNQSGYDSTDVHSNLNFNTQNERWTAGISEQTDYDTTRTSELSDFNIPAESVRHLGLSVAPQLSYSPEVTDKIALQGQVLRSTYDSTTYANYLVGSVTPSYTRTFDPNNSALINLNAQEYRTTSGSADKVDSIGPSVGWITSFSPSFQAEATVGAQESRQFSANAPSQSWKLDYIYSIDLSYKGDQDRADLISSRANYPLGNGTESLLTTVTVNEVHQLNKTFSLNVGLDYEAGDYQTTTPGSVDALYTGRAGVAWHITDHIDGTANYQYRYETLTGNAGNAQDNLVLIGLSYKPKAWAL